jgi:hypothetical protein
VTHEEASPQEPQLGDPSHVETEQGEPVGEPSGNASTVAEWTPPDFGLEDAFRGGLPADVEKKA